MFNFSNLNVRYKLYAVISFSGTIRGALEL